MGYYDDFYEPSEYDDFYEPSEYDDFYEPSEYEIMVEQFKDELRKSVKQEIQDEMERLRKENQELQEIKRNFNKALVEEQDNLRKKANEFEEAKINLARKKVDELFKEAGLYKELYTIRYKRVRKKKCDKCDEDRKIWYKTPSGKDAFEYCECSYNYNKYKPEKVKYIYYTTIDRGKKLLLQFNSDDHWTVTHDPKNVYKDGMDFSDMQTTWGRALFENEEDCQRFCDYLNEKEGITDDME